MSLLRSIGGYPNSSCTTSLYHLVGHFRSTRKSILIGQWKLYQFGSSSLTVFEHQQREFRSLSSVASNSEKTKVAGGIRISYLLSKHLGLSRRQSERMILLERVTLFGKTVNSPSFELTSFNKNDKIAIKLDGKLIHGVENTLQSLLSKHSTDADDPAERGHEKKGSENILKDSTSTTRIWLANKLRGELITDDDPHGRPSMLQRLVRGGVGDGSKKNLNGSSLLPTHLKPIGRLDMMTEGLMIFTNDGHYARTLELPVNQLWRTYRVRVHGCVTSGKLIAIRKGLTVHLDEKNEKKDNSNSADVVEATRKVMKYKGMKVNIERSSLSLSNRRKKGRVGQGYATGTNTWLQITCAEGKNRQLRRVLEALGLDVTRLIRISYGDYDLNTIPPGRAIEVPCKRLESMKKRGALFVNSKRENSNALSKRDNNRLSSGQEDVRPTIEWINYS